MMVSLCEMVDDWKCQHTLRAGKRKNTPCHEPGTYENSIRIPYCDKHKVTHRADWISHVEAEEGRKRKKRKDDRELYQQLLAAAPEVNARTLADSSTILNMERLWQARIEPFSGTVVEAVDELLMDAAKSRAHYVHDIGPLSRLHIYPCDFRGFSVDEIQSEVNRRLYETAVMKSEKGTWLLCSPVLFLAFSDR